MTHDDAFLQAILEDPDDDTPRLVYADWLEEHGQPERAEFIRVQCERARLQGEENPSSDAQERLAALQRREDVLLGAHRKAWTRPLPEWARGKAVGFARGFVVTVRASAGLFLQHGAELFRVAPVQHLALESVGDRMAALAASPLLLHLRSLFLDNQRLDDSAARALAASSHLANLTILDLGNNRLTAEGAQALAASPHLGRLVRLYLGGNMLGAGGVVALAQSPRLPGLMLLDLSRNGVGDAGAVALAGASSLAGLGVLHLQSNGIGEEGALALAASPYLGDLEEINLGTNPINARGVRALRNRFGSRVHL
jgi:uncharacterized protein (TIGR02996 family)